MAHLSSTEKKSLRLVGILIGLILGAMLGGTIVYHANTTESNPSQIAYVFNGLSSNVAIIDIETKEILSKIDIAIKSGQYGAQVSNDQSRIYLIEHGGNRIFILDSQSLEIKSRIPAGKNLQHEGVFTKDGKYFLAISRNEESLVIIDTEKEIVENKIKIGKAPHDVTIDDKNKFAFTTDTGSKTISKINIESLEKIESYELNSNPHMILSANGRLYIGASDPPKIIILESDNGEKLEEIELQSEPHGIALDRDKKILFVTLPKSNSIKVINTDDFSTIKDIPVGEKPHNIEIINDNTLMFVTNSGDGTVSIIDIETLIETKRITTGSGPHNTIFIESTTNDSNDINSNKEEEILSANFNCG